MDIQTEPFPYIPLEIVEAVERMFPNRCPTQNMSDRQVWISVGSIGVARYLRSQYEAQQGG